MRRTINEKKAHRYIFVGFLIHCMSLGILGMSAREQIIILGSLSLCGCFVGLVLLCYNFYSLGWEYKRIDIEGDSHKNTKEKRK